MKFYTILFILLCFLYTSCTDEKNESRNENYDIKGKVEKGPFVKGSKVTLQPLNSKFIPTGDSYFATILDSEGNFNFGSLELESPYALLTADGYYFHEIQGELSQGPISLKALVDLLDNSSVNLNVLTHLKQDRIQHLIQEEQKSFKEANQQAQTEILTCFALQEYANKDVSSFSITSGTDEAGALIIASSMLLQNKSDAEFTEYITDLSQEFKNTGTFSADHKKELIENSYNLDLSRITYNIIKRYQSLNKEISIPDLSYYIDWDNDGIAGNELGDKNQEKLLEFETDTLKISVNGGEYRVKINTTIPYTFNLPGGAIPEISFPQNPIINTTPIIFQKSLSEDNYLILNVEPSSSFFMQDATITLYSYDGNISTSLILQQEGDNTKIEDPSSEIYDILIPELSKTFNYTFSTEAIFSQCYIPNEDQAWQEIYDHTLNSENSIVYDIWRQAYATIAITNVLIDEVKDRSVYIESMFKNIRAMVYYHMVCLFEAIPFKTTSIVEDRPFPKVPINEIYDYLKLELEKCIELFPAAKNNNQIAVSKATPQTLLAKIYMETGNYTDALNLLKDIISSEQYTLSTSRSSALNNRDEELIFALPQTQDMLYTKLIESNNYLPVLRYTEVFLLAAECEYHLGNTTEAMSYLSKIQQRVQTPNITSDNFMAELTQTWKTEIPGEFSYFFFLKRNKLIKGTLGIEKPHTVLPTPMRELMVNPALIQHYEYTM